MLALLIASTLGQAIPVATTPPGHFYNRPCATIALTPPIGPAPDLRGPMGAAGQARTRSRGMAE